MIAEKKHEPRVITPSLHQLGTVAFPAFLSLGEYGMIIEGGTGATAAIIIEQIREMGIPPERIKYLVLTHTHTDHIGAVPHLKKLWPHLKVVASSLAAKLLKNQETIENFRTMDRTLAEIMLSKGEIAQLPDSADDYVFEVDSIVHEGDRLELGKGIVWKIYDAPGHSPCHIALYEEGEEIVAIGDATGFYVPEKDVFWPNYFHSLEAYCTTIKKLHSLSARTGVLSHNHVIRGDVGGYLERALEATEAYHREMLERLGRGEDVKEIAMEKARWVNTLTTDHPFGIMYTLSRALIKRSQTEADKPGLFDLE